jgi:hypothetical protein
MDSSPSPAKEMNIPNSQMARVRFRCSKQIVSYLVPVGSKKSSRDRDVWGYVSKHGNSLLRFLLGKSAQVTVHNVPEERRTYFPLAMRRGRNSAKVALARKRAVRLYCMIRKGRDYQQLNKFGSHAGQLGGSPGETSQSQPATPKLLVSSSAGGLGFQ